MNAPNCAAQPIFYDNDSFLAQASYGRNAYNFTHSKDKHQVDFCSASEKRTFTIKLDGGNLYVNPHYFLTMSEKFRKQFEEIDDVKGEITYEDIPMCAMKVVLESVCPTIHQLYPIPIQISDLPGIIPVANKLEMPILLNLCSKVLDSKIPESIVTPYGYLKYFDLAYRYGLNIAVQTKLLYHLLDFDFNKIAKFLDETILSTETGSLKNERFPHDVYGCLLMPSEMQNVRCERCFERQSKRRSRRRDCKNTSNNEILTPCKLCSRLLCDKCIPSPCLAQLEKFLIENPPSCFPKL
uniref:BTB domain-containing protein n=1 Tax=Syphacia muris TaxID=451379 RepID=A0A0N5AQ76_9BILA